MRGKKTAYPRMRSSLPRVVRPRVWRKDPAVSANAHRPKKKTPTTENASLPSQRPEMAYQTPTPAQKTTNEEAYTTQKREGGLGSPRLRIRSACPKKLVPSGVLMTRSVLSAYWP